MLKNTQHPLYHSIFPFHISTEQEIKNSSFFENKVSSIDLCIESIDGLIIEPQEVFSFWHLIPEPSTKNGFKIERQTNLLNAEFHCFHPILENDLKFAAEMKEQLKYVTTYSNNTQINSSSYKY